MIATISHNDRTFSVDLSKPIDISIAISNTDANPIAWYLDKPQIEPVRFGDWIGKVSEGSSSTNFNNISFNPHAHGTHTECLGHITHDFYSINKNLTKFFFTCEVISIEPGNRDGDLVIGLDQLKAAIKTKASEAIAIRTLPNPDNKKSKKYSHTNPPYLSEDAALFLRGIGVKHLLIDLPSVDREEDEGKLLAHKAFWNLENVNNLNDGARLDATITEMVFIGDHIEDGEYLLNLQVASFENDASPSKPILYKIV